MLKKILTALMVGAVVTTSVSNLAMSQKMKTYETSATSELATTVKSEIVDYLASGDFPASEVMTLTNDDIDSIANAAVSSITPEVLSGATVINTDNVLTEISSIIDEKIREQVYESVEASVAEEVSASIAGVEQASSMLTDQEIEAIRLSLEESLNERFDAEVAAAMEKTISDVSKTISSQSVTKDALIAEVTSAMQTYVKSVNLKGADGKTPVKGVDYFTTTEVSAISNNVKNALIASGQLKGDQGKSAYILAVEGGYVGTETEWLASLKGTSGTNGLTAYQIAVAGGYSGTEAQWVSSLDGTDGKSAYELAVDSGFVGTESDWLNSLIGTNGTNGESAYELAVLNGYTGTEAEWVASLEGAVGKSTYQLAVENGYTGTEAEWIAESNPDNMKAEVQTTVLTAMSTALATVEGNLNGSISAVNSDIAAIESSMLDVSLSVNNLEADLTSTKGELNTVSSNLASTSTTVGENTTNISQHTSDIGVLSSLTGQISNDLSSVVSSVSQNSTDISGINTTVGTLLTEITQSKEDIGNINTNLNGFQFSIGGDGMPYVTYKVGADTVTKKLGDVSGLEAELATGKSSIVQHFADLGVTVADVNTDGSISFDEILSTIDGLNFAEMMGLFQFDYVDHNPQIFKVPMTGTYIIEAYGAGSIYGQGQYVRTEMLLEQNTVLYIYPGKSQDSSGWQGTNRGGAVGGTGTEGYTSVDTTGYYSSGATDVRVVKATDGSWYDTGHASWNTDASLMSRIVTAGGGTGAAGTCNSSAWAAGTGEWQKSRTSSIIAGSNNAVSNGTLGQGTVGYGTGYKYSSNCTSDCYQGNVYGGGGGGYNGGTAGNAGTSYVANGYVFGSQTISGANTTITAGKNYGDGFVKISMK